MTLVDGNANWGNPEEKLKSGNSIKEIKELEGNDNNNESNQDDFTGTLRGDSVTLKDVKTKEILYKKRSTDELNELRNKFNSSVRKEFLIYLHSNLKLLKDAGFSEDDISRIGEGKVPEGWQVHHKLPLDDGGTNSFDNLVLIKNEPYHKVITNFQNSFAKQLQIGETKRVDWPMVNGNIYPKKS